ncbi:MAG: aldehyde dehydrogenase family protein [Leadbetterella sp.]
MNDLESPIYNNIINGEKIPSLSNKTKDLISPATGKYIGSVTVAGIKDVEEAVNAAKIGFESWSKLTAYQRESTIKKSTAYVRTQAQKIGHLMAQEQGKPLSQCTSEVLGSCDTIDYYASEGVRIEGETHPTEKIGVTSVVKYYPIGVCALITPWNYPLSLLSWKLGPALASGCTAVVKPSPYTPMCSTAFVEALIQGGIPGSVVQIIHADLEGSIALVKHEDVKKVALTGSVSTGKKILEMTAPHLKKITLELGGHCPAIVCEDADIANAATTIVYKGFRNMGQSCSSINRVYIHKNIYKALLEKLIELSRKLTIGDGISDPNVDLGPMTTKEGIIRCQNHIHDAVSKGGRVVLGGNPPEGDLFADGNYFLPTILDNCNSDMLVMREETFGPLIAIEKVENLAEAIEKANASEYGLVAYGFTKDYKTTQELSEKLEVGTVCINNGAVNTNYAPYVGWKNSGYGIELSRKSIFEYLKIKHIKIEAI